MNTQTLKNPSAPVIVNPIGIDAAIQKLQVAIAAIPWIEKSFARARPMTRMVLTQKKVEPMVYQGSEEYYPVLPNDALKAYSFFRANGPRQTDGYEPNLNYKKYFFRDPVDLIVWGNLKLIDSSKDYVFTEELVRDVLNILNRDANVSVVRVYDDKVDEIYKGYSLDDAHRDLLLYPYTAFRIELSLRYEIACA